MRRQVAMCSLSLLLFGLACGGGGDSRVKMACTRIMDAICAKFVECRANPGGMVITAQSCTQIRAGLIESCEMDNGAGITAGTDADVTECAQGLAAQPCSTICNQIPVDPPACQRLDPEPNTDTVTCSP